MTPFDITLSIIAGALMAGYIPVILFINQMQKRHDNRVDSLTKLIRSRDTWDYQALRHDIPLPDEAITQEEDGLQDKSDLVDITEVNEEDLYQMIQMRDSEEAPT